MPRHDYECPYCEYVFEVERKITEPVSGVEYCEKCQRYTAKLLPPGGGTFILKCRGFHNTEYRDKPVYPKNKE